MNSPLIPAMTACFEKAVSVAMDVHGSVTQKEQFVPTLRAVFRQELTALRNAIIAEERSRKVAVAELRKTVDESIDEYQTNVDLNGDPSAAKDEFLFAVGQWMDRLES